MELPAAAVAVGVAEQTARQLSPVVPGTVNPASEQTQQPWPMAVRSAPAEPAAQPLAARSAPEVPRVFRQAPAPDAPERAEAMPPEAVRAIEAPARGNTLAEFEADPAVLNRITDSVMKQMDRRIQAYRERTGTLR
jgi:hypothetical protein